ncbi:MAG: FAD-dependent oxidoreductase, partial [Bryobacteraceae bacterium]|nr:FAD-dependent oxidoreductase [Bryobacteraceae bacterium]
ILLVDNSPRILGTFPEDLSHHAEGALIRLGVRSIFHAKVTGVDSSGITMMTNRGEEHIEARTVLWAAGVTGSPVGKILAARTGMQLQRGGRVPVDEHCNVAGHPEIYVIGDLAWQAGKDCNPLPGVAPVAMQQGPYVAKAILDRLGGTPLEPFHYFDKGTLAVIGRASAVAYFGKLHLHGLIAWLIWLFVHLMFLVSFQNRLIVFIRWGFNYVTYNRGARLITGDPAPYEAFRDSSPEEQAAVAGKARG